MATEVDATLPDSGGGRLSPAKPWPMEEATCHTRKLRKGRQESLCPCLRRRPSRLRLKNPCGATGSWIFANRSTASVRRPIAAIGGLRGRSRNVCRTLPASVLTLATWPVSPKGHSSKGFPAARPCLLRPLPNRRPRCDKSWPGLRQRCLRRWRCSGSWPLGGPPGLRGAVSPGPDGRARGAILAVRQAQADKLYRAAIKSLALIRQFLPAVPALPAIAQPEPGEAKHGLRNADACTPVLGQDGHANGMSKAVLTKESLATNACGANRIKGLLAHSGDDAPDGAAEVHANGTPRVNGHVNRLNGLLASGADG